MLAESHIYFHKAADVLGLADHIRTIVLTPMRTVKVDIVTESEDGKLLHHVGYRVQHNRAMGPCKGLTGISISWPAALLVRSRISRGSDDILLAPGRDLYRETVFLPA